MKLTTNTTFQRILNEELERAKRSLNEIQKISWIMSDINSKDFKNYKALGFNDVFNVKRKSNRKKKLKDLSVQEYLETFKQFADKQNWKEKNYFNSKYIMFAGPNYKKNPFKSIDIFILPKANSLMFEDGFKGKRKIANVSGVNVYEVEDYFDWIKELDKKATTFEKLNKKDLSKSGKIDQKIANKIDKSTALALKNGKAVKKIKKNLIQNKLEDRSVDIPTSKVTNTASVPVDASGQEDTSILNTKSEFDGTMPVNFKTGFNKKAGDAYRRWANSTPELSAAYGKDSEFDLDDVSPKMKPDNSFIRKSLYAAMQDYENEQGELAISKSSNRTKFGAIKILYNSQTAKTDSLANNDNTSDSEQETKPEVPAESPEVEPEVEPEAEPEEEDSNKVYDDADEVPANGDGLSF